MKQMKKVKIPSKLLKLIKENRDFLIVTHINPEGDAIGSSLALAQGLKKLGKRVSLVDRNPVPEVLKFLPSSGQFRQKAPQRAFDVLLIVDCNTLQRTGFKSLNARKTAVIDHHLLPADAGKSMFHSSLSASLIDPAAAAAGVLVYNILTALKISIDKKMATNLYTAILTDTGGFRYSNTDTEALKIASELVEAGAKPWDITKEVHESNPAKAMKLLGLVLSTLEEKDGIAWITATKDMFKKTGTTAEDCEDFVDYPRKVKDVDVAVFFREDSKGLFKLSLRSKGRVNVQKIAAGFGGGGHAAAAGCKMDGTLQEVKKKVFRAVRSAIRKT